MEACITYTVQVPNEEYGWSWTNAEGICHRKAQKDAYSAHGPEPGVASTHSQIYSNLMLTVWTPLPLSLQTAVTSSGFSGVVRWLFWEKMRCTFLSKSWPVWCHCTLWSSSSVTPLWMSQSPQCFWCIRFSWHPSEWQEPKSGVEGLNSCPIQSSTACCWLSCPNKRPPGRMWMLQGQWM